MIRSNLNALINQAEDPEKMLDQILIDMRQQLQEAKREVAAAIADEKRLAAQLEAVRAQVREWDRRAVLAVERGEDDLAREALRRKAEQQQLAAGYQSQWEAQEASTTSLKQALRALSEKIDEAARKKNLLVARQKRAEAQKHIHEVMAGCRIPAPSRPSIAWPPGLTRWRRKLQPQWSCHRSSAVKQWSNASEHWRDQSMWSRSSRR